MMEKRTIKGKELAHSMVWKLVDAEIYYEFKPLPNDEYEFTVEDSSAEKLDDAIAQGIDNPPAPIMG